MPHCECCPYPRLAGGLTVPINGASHLGGCLRGKQGHRDVRCDSNGGVDTGRGWKFISGAGPKGQQVAWGPAQACPQCRADSNVLQHPPSACERGARACERGARAKPALRELFRMAAMVGDDARCKRAWLLSRHRPLWGPCEAGIADLTAPLRKAGGMLPAQPTVSGRHCCIFVLCPAAQAQGAPPCPHAEGPNCCSMVKPGRSWAPLHS